MCVSGFKRSISFLMKTILAVCVGLAYCTNACAESIEVHTVLATEPGKPGAIPSECTKFKAALGASAFAKFSSVGVQTVNITAAVPKASVPVGGYTLELIRQSGSKVDVTVKEVSKKDGVKTVLGPLTYTFAKERTKQLELPMAKGTYIVFLTLEKE